MQRLLLMLAAHCGWFFDHKWRCDNKTDVELGILKANNQLWLRVHDQHVVAVLDALHTMMNMSNILLTSEFVSAVATQNAVIPLHNYHREASIDDFYDLSMVADCPVGSIVQYKHRFRFLFHSVSQVIFFHYPNYARHKQLPLTELQNPTCNSIHILPLLQQIDPDIPVFHEHTGATMSSLINLTTQHNWAWLVLGRHIVLFNNLKQSFCAFDLRTLLAKVNPLLCEHTHHKDESNTWSCSRCSFWSSNICSEEISSETALRILDAPFDDRLLIVSKLLQAKIQHTPQQLKQEIRCSICTNSMLQSLFYLRMLVLATHNAIRLHKTNVVAIPRVGVLTRVFLILHCSRCSICTFTLTLVVCWRVGRGKHIVSVLGKLIHTN